MRKYQVTIIKTVSTTVIIEAESASKAHKLVELYGLIEATSDFTMISEDVFARITKVQVHQ